MNMLGKNLPTVVQDHLCVTRLQLGWSVFRSAVSCAFGLPCKCPVSLHPLQALASPSISFIPKPCQSTLGRAIFVILQGMSRAEGAYDRNPVSVSHSHSLSDLKSFLLMKAQLIHQLSLAFWYSQMKRVPVSPASGWSDVTPRVLTASFPA